MIFSRAKTSDNNSPTLAFISWTSSGTSLLWKVPIKYFLAWLALVIPNMVLTMSLAKDILASRGPSFILVLISSSGKAVQISKPKGIISSGQLMTLPKTSFGSSVNITMLPSLLPIFLPTGSMSNLVAITNFPLPRRLSMVRPANMLKVWSLPPISASTPSWTESYPCIKGYKNSWRKIGLLALILSWNISRSTICPKVNSEEISTTCEKFNFFNHWLL